MTRSVHRRARAALLGELHEVVRTFTLEGAARVLGQAILARVCYGLLLASMIGCAHQPVKQDAPADPIVAAPPRSAPPPAVAVAPPDPVDDFAKALEGAVLYFEFNRAALTAESMGRLLRLADALRAHPNERVKISGHCDERGTQEYNLALGQTRAQAARNYLVALGIQPSRVEVVSYGAEVPIDPGQGESAWARNRRDEITRPR